MTLNDLDIGKSVMLQVSSSKIESAILVAIVKANVVPNRDDIVKWYGDTVAESRFVASPTARLVFELANGRYVVMADRPETYKVIRQS